jgi:hypothetical protein
MTWKDMSNALSPSCQSVLGEAITMNSKNPPITATMCAGQGTFKPQISLWTPRSPLQSSPIPPVATCAALQLPHCQHSAGL